MGLAFADVIHEQCAVLCVECGGLVLRTAAHNPEIGNNTVASGYLPGHISRRQGEIGEAQDSYDLVGGDRDVRPWNSFCRNPLGDKRSSYPSLFCYASFSDASGRL